MFDGLEPRFCSGKTYMPDRSLKNSYLYMLSGFLSPFLCLFAVAVAGGGSGVGGGEFCFVLMFFFYLFIFDVSVACTFIFSS